MTACARFCSSTHLATFFSSGCAICQYTRALSRSQNENAGHSTSVNCRCACASCHSMKSESRDSPEVLIRISTGGHPCKHTLSSRPCVSSDASVAEELKHAMQGPVKCVGQCQSIHGKPQVSPCGSLRFYDFPAPARSLWACNPVRAQVARRVKNIMVRGCIAAVGWRATYSCI